MFKDKHVLTSREVMKGDYILRVKYIYGKFSFSCFYHLFFLVILGKIIIIIMFSLDIYFTSFFLSRSIYIISPISYLILGSLFSSLCILKCNWSGRTWRERVGREVGGGIGMGKTCEPKAFSFQCMTKFTTIKKIK